MVLADQVAQLDIPGKLVPPSNWHLTLRFLGAVDQVTFERFVAGLDQAELPDRFMIRLGSIGGFPNHRKATVVWAAVESGGESLSLLNEIAEEASLAAGLSPEERPFRPHLTLSRARPPRKIKSGEDFRVEVEWVAHRVTIFESHLGRGAARYEPLESVELG